MKIYITLDDYYTVSFYNKTLKSLENNEIEFREYISLEYPFNRILGIDKKDIPKFIDYKIVRPKRILETLKPKYSNKTYEEKILRRKNGLDSYVQDYTIPQDFLQKDFFCVFKSSSYNAMEISTTLKNKIFIIRTEYEDIYVSTNPYVKNYIRPSNIVAEGNGWIVVEQELLRKGFELNKTLNLSYFLGKKLVIV